MEKEDLWDAIELADDDLEDGAYWAMVADMLDCDVIDVIDAVAEHGAYPPDDGE